MKIYVGKLYKIERLGKFFDTRRWVITSQTLFRNTTQ